jgi:hypothetical protein
MGDSKGTRRGPGRPTSEAVGHVNRQLDVAEEHGKGHREVGLGLEGDVPVAGLQTVQRQDPLAQQLAALLVDSWGCAAGARVREKKRSQLVAGTEAERASMSSSSSSSSSSSLSSSSSSLSLSCVTESKHRQVR